MWARCGLTFGLACRLRVRVKDWTFPSQIKVGFNSHIRGGSVKVSDGERSVSRKVRKGGRGEEGFCE